MNKIFLKPKNFTNKVNIDKLIIRKLIYRRADIYIEADK